MIVQVFICRMAISQEQNIYSENSFTLFTYDVDDDTLFSYYTDMG